YTTTTNGNIGRFCRRAAIEGIGKLLPLIINEEDKILILQEQLNLSIGKVIERACESIDDLRQKASNVLTKLVTSIKDNNNHPLHLYIKEFNLLEKIFYLKNKEEEKEEENKEFSNKDWLTSKGFERLSLLLNSTTYGNFALSGFVLSAGSVCAWTMENAFLAIVSYLKPHKKDIKNFLNNLLLINSKMSERQIDPTPILILFRMLFNDGQLKCLEENADNSIIFSNFYKLIYKLLFSLQTSPYAAIREKVASQLFEAFSLLIEEEEEKQINLALELLAQTDWSKWGDEKMNNSFLEIKRILKGI
uniref:Tubulin-specific chaperone D C-terminal domain-containing protein n=1 Tax=Meloidogyne floridensis TaxID=298350 RepID=A0A915NSY1_9BILA